MRPHAGEGIPACPARFGQKQNKKKHPPEKSATSHTLYLTKPDLPILYIVFSISTFQSLYQQSRGEPLFNKRLKLHPGHFFVNIFLAAHRRPVPA
jgi:hypothetical protein